MTTTPALDIAEPILKRYARRMLRRVPACDRDDIMQDVRVLLLTRIIPRYDPARGELRPYLTWAIENALLDERERRGRAKKLVSLDDDNDDDAIDPADPRPHGLDALDEAQALADSIVTDPERHLPERLTELLNGLLETKDRDELARKLGVQIETIYKQNQRLKRHIKNL